MILFFCISLRVGSVISLISAEVNIFSGDFITFNNLDEKGKYIKTKIIKKTIYKDVDELLLDNDIERILPGRSKEDLVEILVKIFKEDFNSSKLVAFKFKYIDSNFDA